MDKLQLNDAALTYEPETSGALGFGFRIGFLGLLHMEIVRERLEREFDLDLISTAPNVVYRVVLESGAELVVTNPSEYPTERQDRRGVRAGREGDDPSPADYIGTILELCQTRRGVQHGMDYLSADRVEIRYTLPLAEIVFDFFDALKSRTKGYASLDYEPTGEQLERAGQGRHPAARRAGRRVLRHRAQGQGVRVRACMMIGQAQGADPAAAVRGADPGGDRVSGDRPRDHPGDAQGCAGQVLRRRHHP